MKTILGWKVETARGAAFFGEDDEILGYGIWCDMVPEKSDLLQTDQDWLVADGYATKADADAAAERVHACESDGDLHTFLKTAYRPLEQELLDALVGLMEAEGGEPGDSPEQRYAWAVAEKAVKAAERSREAS